MKAQFPARAAALAAAAMLLGAAGGPRALSSASGGLWQVSRDARGLVAQDVCIAEPALLGQWQHRGERCERTVLTDEGSKTLLSYSCPGGGFGRSEISLLTPRTLRVATQGIAADGPFNYVIHARRIGNCRPR